jgi:hypothetical protein
MNHRERFCTKMMYLCFTTGALILMHGMTLEQQAQSDQLAHRGSGRIEVATQPPTR